jgi:hypothetical protein
MVGWEGIWGTLLYIVVLVCFYFVNCDPDNKVCYKYIDEGIAIAKLDNWIFAFKQIGNSAYVAIFSVCYICCISCYNYVGINITKYVSSPARAVMDNARTVLIWIFFLLPFWSDTSYKELTEKFSVLQLIGFIFLIFGTLVYNEFITLPILGLDKYTKVNLQRLKDQDTKDDA